MLRRRLSSPMRKLLVAGAIALSLAVVTLAVMHWQSPGVIVQARLAALDATGDREVRALLQSWADEDDDLTFFVARLGDERAAVAEAAGEVLGERMSQWQSLRSETSSPLAAQLAQQLAHQPEARSLAGRRAAGNIAAKIVRWPLDDRQVDALAVLADCDKILRAAALGNSNELMQATAMQPAGDGAMMIARRSANARAPGDLDIAAPLAGGGLPHETAELPPHVIAEEPTASSAAEPETNEPFTEPGEIYAPLATPLDVLQGKERSEDRTATGDRDGRLLQHSDTPTDVSDIAAANDAVLSRLDDWTLMQRLHAADSTAAEAELRRRGHSHNTLALARKLTDADPRVRCQLAELLPQLVSIDPQPWLLQLGRDPHPDVRRTAIAVLASSNDASVTRWLERLRDDESDARVAAAIDELLRKRR